MSSRNAYLGIDSLARRIKNMYVGVDGVARTVKAGYVGVGGVARQFYPQPSSSGGGGGGGGGTTPDPVYPSTTTVSIAASKCIFQTYTSLSQSNMDICYVGRAVHDSDSDSKAGAALKFNAPAAGWGYYSKATLHLYRNGGSASAPTRVGKLSGSYSNSLSWEKFYYGNYNSSDFSDSISGGNGWKSVDITSFLPTGSGELGITLISLYSYITIDGNPSSTTAAYIQLSR